jgi:hypothetical protein
MVIARMVELNYLKPKLERIRAQARAEFAEKVQEWNRRRLEAEARGELFDEPLPDPTKS